MKGKDLLENTMIVFTSDHGDYFGDHWMGDKNYFHDQSSPVCMPNRASLMSCRMPSSHGVRSLGIPLALENVTFVEMLHNSIFGTKSIP